jgi:MoaA/NifB/PqqE/SkfB family radical SAM enzyme
MLRLVEIELHSNCNRACDWCPNKLIPERQLCFDYMDETILLNIVTDLTRMKYEGYISFSRYNEPFKGMYDINDFWQMELLISHLPKCTFVSNTNGDYLDKGCFELISLYIDELTIMNYDNLPEEKMADNLKYWAEKHPIKIEKNSKGLYTEYKGMKVRYANWKNWNITNRGGLLEEVAEPRTCRCLEPHFFIGVNWDGTVSPCCNIRSPQEFPQHEPFCLGNLKEKSLQEMLNSSTMFRFREQAYYPDKDFGYDLNPCQYCSNAGGRYTRKEGGILYD